MAGNQSGSPADDFSPSFQKRCRSLYRSETPTSRLEAKTGEQRRAIEGERRHGYVYITPDGRYVIYDSVASNLVNQKNKNLNQKNRSVNGIFLYDRISNKTKLISVDIHGNQFRHKITDYLMNCIISQDGKTIFYHDNKHVYEYSIADSKVTIFHAKLMKNQFNQ